MLFHHSPAPIAIGAGLPFQAVAPTPGISVIIAAMTPTHITRLLVRTIRAIALSIAAFLAFWALVCIMVIVQGQRDEERQADVAIALDAQRGPSDAAALHQLDQMLELHRHGLVETILLPNGAQMEASKRYLVQHGMPEASITTVPEAPNLTKRLHQATDLAHSNGKKSMLIVGEPASLLRALKITHDLGFLAYATPTPVETPLLQAISTILRESWAYMSYIFTGE